VPLRRRLSVKPQLRALIALVVALSAAVALPLVAPAGAAAAPSADAVVLTSRTASMTASLSKPTAAVSPTGTLNVSITVVLRAPAADLSVRLQLRRPSGHVIYQKTQTKTSVKAGAFTFTYSRPLSDFDLREGAYRLQADVTAGSRAPLALQDRLFVVDPDRRRVPLVLVARLNCAPMTGPDGRFVVDPATNTRARDDVSSLAAMVRRTPALRLTLGIAPLMLDEWRRILSGYEVVRPEGVAKVAKDAPVVTTYATSLDALRGIARDPRVEVLDVPFADPDLGGLVSIRALDDLKRQYDRGISVYQASLGTTPSAGSAFLGDALPEAALGGVRRERIDHVVLKASAIGVETSTTSPGLYRLRGSQIRALPIDEKASALAADGPQSTAALLDRIFERMTSDSSGGDPITLAVRLGPGATTDVASLDALVGELAHSGLVRFETAAQAARGRTKRSASPAKKPDEGRAAPAGYWSDVAKGRSSAVAFSWAAAGKDDAADSALYDALVSESRCWAGPDDLWSFADRGRSFALAAARLSARVLGSIDATSVSITLSGSVGKVPLTIRNGSSDVLQVFVVASAQHARFPSGARVKVTLRPGDNYVTVPVDLGAGGVYDRVRLDVVSVNMRLASTTVDVHASYLDRLVLVATVVIVLAALLFYIRRKVRVGEADI
jgi:hypothetical protein